MSHSFLAPDMLSGTETWGLEYLKDIRLFFSYSSAVKQYSMVYKSKRYAFTKCPNLSGRAEEQEVGFSCLTWNHICEIVLLSFLFSSCSIIFIFQSDRRRICKAEQIWHASSCPHEICCTFPNGWKPVSKQRNWYGLIFMYNIYNM